jgi:Rha family phage regulatory protein
MNQLATINNGQVVVSSRQIAENFEKRHDSILRDIENLAKNITPQNCGMLFIQSEYKNENNRMFKEYLLTRDGFSLLVMGFTGQKALEWKLKYIEAFNKMEKMLTTQSPSYQIADPIERAKAWIQEQEEKKALEGHIEELKPKALFADSVTASKTSILVGDLAKLLRQNGHEVGQNRLFEILRRNGFLIRKKGGSYNMPTQRSMEQGLFEIKETVITHSDGHTTISKTPKVTGTGQVYFVNKFINGELS